LNCELGSDFECRAMESASRFLKESGWGTRPNILSLSRSDLVSKIDRSKVDPAVLELADA
jgi:hypothetical protein